MADRTWDPDVMAAIAAAGPAGATLEEILGTVDARQRIVLGLDELNGSLGRLVASGRVTMQPSGRYGRGQPMTAAMGFEPVGPIAYAAALRAYKRSVGQFIWRLKHQSRRARPARG